MTYVWVETKPQPLNGEAQYPGAKVTLFSTNQTIPGRRSTHCLQVYGWDLYSFFTYAPGSLEQTTVCFDQFPKERTHNFRRWKWKFEFCRLPPWGELDLNQEVFLATTHHAITFRKTSVQTWVLARTQWNNGWLTIICRLQTMCWKQIYTTIQAYWRNIPFSWSQCFEFAAISSRFELCRTSLD